MRINQKIKRIRLSRGLTLEKLALLSNLTKGYLSKVERSVEPPPVSTLQTIAVALNVDISSFFEESSGDESGDLEIIHDKDGNAGYSSQAGYSYRPLVKHFRNRYMTPFLMTIDPGETESFTHDSEEFCHVIEGSIEFHYDGNMHKLGVGDSFYFDSRKPHHFVNTSSESARVLAVNFNYRRF